MILRPDKPHVRAVRSLARRLGVTRILQRLQASRAYEERFANHLLEAVRSGDRVWDIGANVGYYTVRFAERVGTGGEVIAFEPCPSTQEHLRKAIAGFGNVEVAAVALGDRETWVSMSAGNDELAATARVEVDGYDRGAKVRMTTADAYGREAQLRAPTVIKLDTEGCEFDVLNGMGELLKSRSLRGIFIEVHFRLLEERGQPDAPSRIVDLLEDAGFSTEWIDASHLYGHRS